MNIPGVDKLIGRLEDVLAKEAELIWRVPGEVKDFKAELENMQAFLIDHADQVEMQAQFAEEVEKKWVADIRDKAYEAEDIIDKFTYHMNKHHHDDISCLSWFLQLVIDAPTTLWVMHQTAHKLQKIKKSITDIAEGHTRYKSGASAHDAAGRTRTRYLEQQQAVRNLRDGAYFIEEETFIGFHRQIESLKKWLTDDKSSRAVISVYGMGGAGKTTLAANIYKTQRGGFDVSAWVTISQTYSITELLRSLIKNFANINKGENESYVELVETLQACLKGKKYLIVLDDVWDTKFWKQMKVALPEDKVGSRILVTTQDERNAPSPSNVKSYKLPVGQLQGSEPWDLFSMKAFADCPNKTCPQELDSLARELVDKCRGLPLALVTLGSHMSSKKQKEEWIDAYKSLYKTPDMNDVKSILMLSFSGLPYSLKHCFLYCCLFPEDYPIKRTRLIRRWIAEGFVEGGDEITPEEEAESYLAELVFRSMLLVETRNVSGRPKVIKMHDVMRDFALEIAKKEKFCGVCDGRETTNEFEAYRWSIQFQIGEELKLLGRDMSRVRSLSLLGNSLSLFGNSPSFLREHLLKFKMLRLLDVEGSVSELTNKVGNLFNLRYLNLTRTRMKKLPSSIGRLLNLQTLDISLTRIDKLPEGVTKLRKLRHLIMGIYSGGIPIAFDISKLNKLQVLIGVRIDKGETLRQLGALTQLTRLDIFVSHDSGDWEERRKNWEALGQLKLLQRFKLRLEVVGDRDINSLIILPPNLKKIYLFMPQILRFQSRWFDSLHNIQRMTLNHYIVSGDQLLRIAALENLVSLELSCRRSDDLSYYWRSDDHEEVLHFSGGFTKLKQLSLVFLFELKKVIFEKGAMPHMESLSISYCSDLQELPEGIEHLTNLQKLELLDVPGRLKDSSEEGIKNWKSKVQHIPTIEMKYRCWYL